MTHDNFDKTAPWHLFYQNLKDYCSRSHSLGNAYRIRNEGLTVIQSFQVTIKYSKDKESHIVDVTVGGSQWLLVFYCLINPLYEERSSFLSLHRQTFWRRLTDLKNSYFSNLMISNFFSQKVPYNKPCSFFPMRLIEIRCALKLLHTIFCARWTYL